MRRSNGAFSPREIRLGMWVLFAALVVSMAGFIANSYLLSPSLGGYEQVDVQYPTGVLEARPLSSSSVAASVTATAISTARP